jgi:preprotein translocase SecE subunit
VAKNMTARKKNTGRMQVTEPSANINANAQSAKTAKAPAREERRTAKTENKATSRRTSKPSAFAKVRNSKAGRFIYDAYYELRYKVTWPTFLEARNMTIMVVAMCVVLGALISAVDFGLYRLFLIIVGGK